MPCYQQRTFSDSDHGIRIRRPHYSVQSFTNHVHGVRCRPSQKYCSGQKHRGLVSAGGHSACRDCTSQRTAVERLCSAAMTGTGRHEMNHRAQEHCSTWRDDACKGKVTGMGGTAAAALVSLRSAIARHRADQRRNQRRRGRACYAGSRSYCWTTSSRAGRALTR